MWLIRYFLFYLGREIMKDIPYGEDYIIYFDKYLYHLYNQGDKLSTDRSIMASDNEFKRLRMRDYHKVVRRYSLKDGNLNVTET